MKLTCMSSVLELSSLVLQHQRRVLKQHHNDKIDTILIVVVGVRTVVCFVFSFGLTAPTTDFFSNDIIMITLSLSCCRCWNHRLFFFVFFLLVLQHQRQILKLQRTFFFFVVFLFFFCFFCFFSMLRMMLSCMLSVIEQPSLVLEHG